MFIYCFFILGLHLWNMEVPRLWVKSELQLPATATARSIARSESCLQSTLQLRATPDPQPTERGQGSNLYPCTYEPGSESTEPQWELPSTLYYTHPIPYSLCYTLPYLIPVIGGGGDWRSERLSNLPRFKEIDGNRGTSNPNHTR